MKEDGVICIDQFSGYELPAKYIHNSNGMYISVYCFNKDVNVENNGPLFFLTEDGRVLSAYDNIFGFRRRGLKPGLGHPYIYVHEIASNLVVVGAAKWEPDCRIRRATLKLAGHGNILCNFSKVDRIDSSNDVKHLDREVANIECTNGTKIRITYDVIFTMGPPKRNEITPEILIEFPIAQNLNEYITYINDIHLFISMCNTSLVSVSQISVGQKSIEELRRIDWREQESDNFVMNYTWGRTPSSFVRDNIAGSPFTLHAYEEIEFFEEALKLWIERDEMWRSSYQLMYRAIEAENEFSAERLLNACKWFESLPTAALQRLIDSDQAKSLSKKFEEIAINEGIDVNANRLYGVLDKIKSETNKQRFNRIFKLLKPKLRKKN